ncbi:hypothetical protein Psesu_0858 [Pseudoxanthomonas suwonensis 11-1]|uniref:Uncharacterized protein n=1 Tax=Pseudoxanthomonas suwonensis (strain 11-1) TaxID=743721 RepID=E6WRH9_PSEUU|nr:hypothetical protein [Pseudoxanthomonas suwonensis]ADV26710.1 hypothetical protein Psesu_0858 [Pseudoxanthomonas suwonensis 11-1]
MALLEDRSAAFIVRIWCERGENPGPGPEWRGSVEHVQSGQRMFFRHLDAVLDFMKPHLEGLGIDAHQRFWERMSSAMEEERDAPAELRFDFAAAGPVPVPAAPAAAIAGNVHKSR